MLSYATVTETQKLIWKNLLKQHYYYYYCVCVIVKKKILHLEILRNIFAFKEDAEKVFQIILSVL